MNIPDIYRKRYIPDEIIHLKDDEIIFIDENKIVTKWNVLHPRNDFAKGYSCYFIKEGYKISKFMDNNDKLVYYYCDIIDTIYEPSDNKYIFCDLLADVIIYPDGKVKVVDIEEIADALEKGLIDCEMAKKALRNLGKLLEIVYSNKAIELVKDYFGGL